MAGAIGGGGRGWRRLATVYGLVEQMRSGELRRAAVAVDEVAAALRMEAEWLKLGAARARGAFAGGDGVDWAVGETTRRFSEGRISSLEEIKEEREEVLDAAVTAHRESRLRMEQMQSVVERARRAADEEERRRAQAAADDRYAGQRWVKRVRGE